ncbi:unnamed protein product [Auanema sp. JU1783]|nr:unnamed protein product [Auanema sp. JU1783]
MRFLIFLTVFYFVAVVVMSAPAPTEELIGGNVPHPSKFSQPVYSVKRGPVSESSEGMRLAQGQGSVVDSRPIWEGGKDVKPWMKDRQRPLTVDPSKSANN